MAVYTQLDHATIAALLKRDYGFSLLFARGIAEGVQNSNYLVQARTAAGKQKYILTLYEQREQRDNLPFSLGLMRHLDARGIACPQPIVRRNNSLWGRSGGSTYALMSFLPGRSMKRIWMHHAQEVGGILGKLHEAAKGFEQRIDNFAALEAWKRLGVRYAQRMDVFHTGLGTLVKDELAFLQEHWPKRGALPRGIIHGDLFPDNVFFTKGRVSGVIDFYLACEDFLAYDVAIAVNAWCFSGRKFDRRRCRALLSHYQKQRPFTPAEKKSFNVLLRGAALRFLLLRVELACKAGEVKGKDPLEYMAKLKFHQEHTSPLL